MEKKILEGQVLREFIADFGGTDRLVCDRSKEQTTKGTDFMKEFRRHRIYLHATNPYCHNQYKVEVTIREMRKK